MMDDPQSWCTIESDPAVFTELCEAVGVKEVEFQELLGIDEESLAMLAAESQVFGLVFLFKWRPENDSREVAVFPPEDLFFARQVITNACATQAILSILMNRTDEIDIGPELSTFREMTVAGAFDPQMKGLAIGNLDTVRMAHNSFQKQSSFQIEHDKDDEKEDAFHFISYVPFRGKVWELDGLKEGPIEVAEVPQEWALGVPGSDALWLQALAPEIRRRIDRYQSVGAAEEAAGEGAGSGELRFTLLAITRDKRAPLKSEQLEKKYLLQRTLVKLISLGEDRSLEHEEEMDDDEAPDSVPSWEALPDEVPKLIALEEQTRKRLGEVSSALAEEEHKRESWKKDNARRRFDFVPFVLCALKHLGRRGELMDAFSEAKKTAEERKEAREQAKKTAGAAK
uniref:Ubiquitin carboxyl-terminal hydrolase n=1 Tax=Chromera velia CCMP2878 TaxID=1169474 RepID=A0A0G4F8U9_9ALVE|mmetsp:Transcript_45138/g.88984  ORF Transcript_45138/g.88984 Transcript_45138/m.88984 type:complete len:398 (-) Transcript_45138:304-1497(-)|eukprot:Cvel_15616.t1-p1 / transcript=Cvel_15616.t1 / gene=Cvel_15616 / organism=Chromera_velia_CCMP2878 / gene_product=Ubiquitin carboxyl-terminal hydrolase isozyme L5, putative / transcript_product=Ubiquitin carboxyl-terminal hydrolase isozyme L5, putative / location=Cvel_scaffold1162:20066-24670(-) / protein_length=397 / sequence_SO=supercontig / SO=protein_coding / is_pseudo=false